MRKLKLDISMDSHRDRMESRYKQQKSLMKRNIDESFQINKAQYML